MLTEEKIDVFLARFKPERQKPMLSVIREEISTYMSQCCPEKAAENTEQIERVAHSLKSIARTIGAMEFGKTAESVETTAAEKNVQALKDHIQTLHEQSLHVVKVLDSKLAQISEGA